MGLGPLRRIGLPAGAAVALALVGGCGTASAPGGTATGGAQAVSTATQGGGVGTRNEAQVYARRLLAALRVPAGAQRAAWPAAQPKPMLAPQLGDGAHVWIAYRTREPMGSVSQFLASHLPPGMKPGGNGRSAQGGAATAEYVNYLPGRLPQGVFAAGLAAVVVPASGGGALLRADAEVTWYPGRSAAEYIQAGRYVSVTVTVPPGPGRPNAVTRTLTEPAVTARLAGLLNGLPALPPYSQTCPAATASPYSLTFTPRLPRWPRIVVTLTGCFADKVMAGGRAQPVLDEHRNAVIAAVRRLPGLGASGSP